MQDTVRQTIGSIVIAWNRAEDAVASMAALYLDVDALTFDLLVKPLRPQDREKLLRAVVGAKEFDREIVAEVDQAIKRSQICRENRNKILHRMGELDGNLTPESEAQLNRVLSEISRECVYLDALKLQIAAVFFDRTSREVPDDGGGTGDDELRPVLAFIPPERPANPKALKFEHLEVQPKYME
ncbi:hypothetical protein SAMN05877809_1099 [Rhodobacter sp. JA431]|uniref:hypothetical protein n=1 Tax=Rhodobacter sp. JA431 TaxID=570013 RepID=UPI000BCA0E50|nr:hypothetical protein [Rhodobacter sp. JA431]SOC16838.1 hypothetical protein SAMN05877809_1099 [Rhodobacter sp. JA431]